MDDERKRFEEWAAKEGLALDYRSSGAFLGWKAHADVEKKRWESVMEKVDALAYAPATSNSESVWNDAIDAVLDILTLLNGGGDGE